MPLEHIQLALESKVPYFIQPVENPTYWIVLLHGYSLEAEMMLKLLEGDLPKDAYVLSLNGPYPFPVKRGEDGFRLGYSWYY
ncbi:MAG: hypothetical protein EOP09_13055, partial [Proteobacteria bacterium]